MATAAVLCIGTELTRGELVNTNGAFLADRLSVEGFQVTSIDTVDDHEGRILAALARLEAADVLIVTGGLGPTTDDITTACVAKKLGVPLLRDEASLAAIGERLSRYGRTVSASNAKQADFPESATILPNPNGTAPGFAVNLTKARAFFLPGVPREMSAMFAESVAPAIQPLVDEVHHQIVLRTYGLPESEVNDRLHGVEARFDVLLGYRATFPVIEVKVIARHGDRGIAAQRARVAADEVRQRLGELVFAEGDVTFAEAIGRVLAERGWRLGAAESCTGGLLGQLLTERSGASEFFLGSIVAYDNAVKTSLLDVPASIIERHGAVSAEVARSMAEGALRRLQADAAVSITGVAGPSGGSAEKPVGLVHYAVATREGTTAQHFVFASSRDFIRKRAAYAALALLLCVALHGHDRAGASALP